MFFNFEIDYKRSVYEDNSKSYIRFNVKYISEVASKSYVKIIAMIL